jgi:hypothetical protein
MEVLSMVDGPESKDEEIIIPKFWLIERYQRSNHCKHSIIHKLAYKINNHRDHYHLSTHWRNTLNSFCKENRYVLSQRQCEVHSLNLLETKASRGTTENPDRI